jgi:hypothetical protein
MGEGTNLFSITREQAWENLQRQGLRLFIREGRHGARVKLKLERLNA